MSSTPKHISFLLSNQQLSFQFNASNSHWVIPFGDFPDLHLQLLDRGTTLLMASATLLDLEGCGLHERAKVFSQLMSLNDRLKLGRVVGSPKVHAEVSLGLCGADLTPRQFLQHFRALTSLVQYLLANYKCDPAEDSKLPPHLAEVLAKLRSRFDPPSR